MDPSGVVYGIAGTLLSRSLEIVKRDTNHCRSSFHTSGTTGDYVLQAKNNVLKEVHPNWRGLQVSLLTPLRTPSTRVHDRPSPILGGDVLRVGLSRGVAWCLLFSVPYILLPLVLHTLVTGSCDTFAWHWLSLLFLPIFIHDWVVVFPRLHECFRCRPVSPTVTDWYWLRIS